MDPAWATCLPPFGLTLSESKRVLSKDIPTAGLNLKILALETSTRFPSASLMDDSQVIATTDSGLSRASGSSAFPNLVKNLLADNGVLVDGIGLIAVSVGPGSFTGLRVGVVLAKTWAWATGCPVVAVSTLNAIAWTAFSRMGFPSVELLRVAVSAQRNQFFAADFASAESAQSGPASYSIIDAGEILRGLGPSCHIVGPGIEPHLPENTTGLGSGLPAGHKLSATAQSIGELGLISLRSNDTVDPFRLEPDYGRVSAAEERRCK